LLSDPEDGGRNVFMPRVELVLVVFGVDWVFGGGEEDFWAVGRKGVLGGAAFYG